MEYARVSAITLNLLGLPVIGIAFLIVMTNGIDEGIESEVADFDNAVEEDRHNAVFSKQGAQVQLQVTTPLCPATRKGEVNVRVSLPREGAFRCHRHSHPPTAG
jgi:hypothetical protein